MPRRLPSRKNEIQAGLETPDTSLLNTYPRNVSVSTTEVTEMEAAESDLASEKMEAQTIRTFQSRDSRNSRDPRGDETSKGQGHCFAPGANSKR